MTDSSWIESIQRRFNKRTIAQKWKPPFSPFSPFPLFSPSREDDCAGYSLASQIYPDFHSYWPRTASLRLTTTLLTTTVSAFSKQRHCNFISIAIATRHRPLFLYRTLTLRPSPTPDTFRLTCSTSCWLLRSWLCWGTGWEAKVVLGRRFLFA